MLTARRKGPHGLVVPHELSSQFLRGVRREDRPAALASVDQREVLRQVFPPLRESALVTTRLRDNRSRVLGDLDRSWVPARAATARYSAHDEYTCASCLPTSLN